MQAEKTTTNEPKEPVSWQYSAPWLKFLRRHIWKIAAIYGVTFITCWSGVQAMRRNQVPPVLSTLKQPSLVDSTNRPFTSAQMAGKVWVVGFIFTRCGSICPAVAQSMLRFQEEVQRSQLGDDVQLLAVTVDPEYDRPEVLQAYAQKLGARPELWTFVGGDKAAVTAFVVDGFKLAVGDRKQNAAGVFDIAHSSKLALVDRHGQVRGYFSATGTPEEVDTELKRLYSALFPVMRAEATDP